MFIQGLQVKDLIKDSETMESTIKKSIQRDSIPDLHLAIQIAKSLNVSVEYLAMGIESSISSSS
ncbi:MAG: hypothetical protein IIT58_13735 [Treponema sp.]|nr:hypothetical protein [Treponema sp.]